MDKWITLKQEPGLGPHFVRLPTGFNEQLTRYFPSVASLLKIIRFLWLIQEQLKHAK